MPISPAPTATQEERPNIVRDTATFSEAFIRWMEVNTSDGISYPRLRLLEALHCQGPGIMRDIAQQIGLTPRNMTAAVDGLEAEGLVTRQPHPSDRRATVIELTKAGQRAADTAVAPHIEAIAELFDDLSPQRQAQFLQALGVLLEGLRQRGVRV